MEKCSYFWLDYIRKCSPLTFSTKNGNVFIFLVRLVAFPYCIFGDWSCCMTHYISVLLLQTDSAGGNCLFVAIKVSMNVCHCNSKDAPYHPTRYFRRQVVAWMIKHCHGGGQQRSGTCQLWVGRGE